MELYDTGGGSQNSLVFSGPFLTALPPRLCVLRLTRLATLTNRGDAETLSGRRETLLPIFHRQTNLCSVGANLGHIHRVSDNRQCVKRSGRLGS